MLRWGLTGTAERKPPEAYQHEVSLSAFVMDKTEVSVQHYVAFLNAIEQDNPRSSLAHFHVLQPSEWDGEAYIALSERADAPMNYVSYFDALAFCSWRGSSLPTEAMWERAAKGEIGRARATSLGKRVVRVVRKPPIIRIRHFVLTVLNR